MPEKFRKGFRCGRALLFPDSTIKKLGFEQVGGSRFCDWYHNYMNFENVRNELVRMYNLGRSFDILIALLFIRPIGEVECEISLYDYRLKPLDQDKYSTV